MKNYNGGLNYGQKSPRWYNIDGFKLIEEE